MLRSLLCDSVWYGVCSVLSVLLSRFVLVREDGRSVGTTLSESQPLCSSFMQAIAFWGRFPWWGDACVSRYHGPSKWLSERRGGPWAPPPLVLLILLAVCCFGRCWVIRKVFLESCFGLLGNQTCVSFCRPSDLSPCRSGFVGFFSFFSCLA